MKTRKDMLKRISIFLFLITGLIAFAQKKGAEPILEDETELIPVDTIYDPILEEMRLEIDSLRIQLDSIAYVNDSIHHEIRKLVAENSERENSNHVATTQKINSVETDSQNNTYKLMMWGIWAVAILLLIGLVVYIVLRRGITKSKNALGSLQNPQKEEKKE